MLLNGIVPSESAKNILFSKTNEHVCSYCFKLTIRLLNRFVILMFQVYKNCCLINNTSTKFLTINIADSLLVRDDYTLHFTQQKTQG